jgi:hypothetical protein
MGFSWFGFLVGTKTLPEKSPYVDTYGSELIPTYTADLVISSYQTFTSTHYLKMMFCATPNAKLLKGGICASIF